MVAGSPCHRGTLWGACLLCRLPILPLACFLAPIPPTPFPAGRGRFLAFFYARGCAPCIPGGWAGRGTGSVNVGGAPWGACPLGRRFALPPRYPTGGMPSLPPANAAFSLFVCPHPPNPLPSGKGETKVILCKGLRPLHPRGWAGRGTGSTSVSGARRGACPLGHRFALPLWYPAGGVPSLPPADATFSFCFCPLPRGRISGGQIRQAPEKNAGS